jgi:hypothetical protein
MLADKQLLSSPTWRWGGPDARLSSFDRLVFDRHAARKEMSGLLSLRNSLDVAAYPETVARVSHLRRMS